jgi:hypothetical protein
MRRLVLILTATCLGVLVGGYFVNRSRRPGQPMGGGRAAEPVGESTVLAAAAGVPGNKAGGRGVPPRFEPTSSSPVQSDPTRPDYDALKLSDIGYSMKDIYEAEPRNERWARAMESRLEKRLLGDLPAFSERGKLAGVECRSSSCEVKVDAPFEDINRMNFGLQYPPLGDAFSPSISDKPIEAGWHRHTVHVLFSPENRDLRALAELDRTRRKLGLEAIQEAHQYVSKLGIDPSKLPPVEPDQ